MGPPLLPLSNSTLGFPRPDPPFPQGSVLFLLKWLSIGGPIQQLPPISLTWIYLSSSESFY